MEDVLNFLFSQVTNVINFLDSWEIIENLSFLRIFIILTLFRIGLKFLIPKKGGN